MLSYDIPKTALIVASDPNVRSSIGATCQHGGFGVQTARHVKEADQAIGRSLPRLVIIDLPRRRSEVVLEWGRKLRSQARTARLPLLVTSGRADIDLPVTVLDAGMDDYIPLPFSSVELLARIKAVIRSRAPDLLDEDVTSGPLSFRSLYREVGALVDGAVQKVPMGPTEYRLLYFLVTNPETVHSRMELLDRLWPADARVAIRTIDAHIRRLRDSLAPFGLRETVETVLQSGYRFTLLNQP